MMYLPSEFRGKMCKMWGNGNCNRNLSEDIVGEILSRLPVKTLMRYKCVCKYWCSLIQDSSFISKHRYHHRHDSACVLALHRDSISGGYAFAMFPDSETLMMPPVHSKVYYHPILCRYHKSIIGPFDGIFCVCDLPKNRMGLWNPSTRELLFLQVPFNPLLSHDPSWFLDLSSRVFGFGMDPKTNVYKLVKIRLYKFSDRERDSSTNKVQVMVYNLGTKSWRSFNQVIPISFLWDSFGKAYKKGVYYWLALNKDREKVIVSFDMSNDMLRTILVPDTDVPTRLWIQGELRASRTELTLYDDCIAMLIHIVQNMCIYYFEIWVMEEEEEEKGCWRKHLRVGPFQKPMRPLGFWNNNWFLVERSSNLQKQLHLYDSHSHQLVNLGVWGESYNFRVFVYKESLTSLFTFGEEIKVENQRE